MNSVKVLVQSLIGRNAEIQDRILEAIQSTKFPQSIGLFDMVIETSLY
jgi:hypothetical protein